VRNRDLSDHLTQTQINNYGRHLSSAVEWLFVSDHLSVCKSCRLEVEKALNPDAVYRALKSEVFNSAEALSSSPEQAHLTFEQLAGLVDGIVADKELRAVNEHLTWCEECEAAVDDLRAFTNRKVSKPDMEPRSSRTDAAAESPWRRMAARLRPSRLNSPAFAFGSAFILILLVLAGRQAWLTLKTKPEISTTTPSVVPSLSPSTTSDGATDMMIAQLNDGKGRITLDQDGKLSGVHGFPPAYQEMIRNALNNQKPERSPLLAGLSLRGSTPRGADATRRAAFSMIEPQGVVTLADRPTFRWSRMDGATGYVVEIYDEDFNLATASPQATSASWTATKPLERGKLYYWQVKAFRDGAEFKAPQAKFRVLAKSGVTELEKARRAHGSSHLTLGLLYLKAGLLNEAEQEFRLLLKANPNSPLAQRLLTQSQTKS
jgi:hypothetical protein